MGQKHLFVVDSYIIIFINVQYGYQEQKLPFTTTRSDITHLFIFS